MNVNEIINRLQNYKRKIEEQGGEVHTLLIKDVASEDEIRKAEQNLACSFPPDFRNALLKLSSHIEFFWTIDEDVLDLPDGLSSIFCGDFQFGLSFLASAENSRKEWINIVFPDYEDPYDRLFHNKLAFYEVGDGDLIALDLEKEGYGNVIYLSHEGDEDAHGFILAHSFSEFLEEWTRLGCVGGEFWQLAPFTNNRNSTLDSHCENAKAWMNVLSIN